jgi:pilus assembly protein Flp/PilA
MMKLLRSLKTSKSGASAAEYALIVAVMGGLVVAGSIAFGNSLQTSLNNSANQLNEDPGVVAIPTPTVQQ